jgi:transcriptional regulator GlxA family with amidase domain
MKRRDFLHQNAALGAFVAAASFSGSAGIDDKSLNLAHFGQGERLVGGTGRLTPPDKGKIPVAFAISQGVTVIDFAGPWEVFQDVTIKERGKTTNDQKPFQLFTVSESIGPLAGSGGLRLVPDYNFENAPLAKVVVVPAQMGSAALHAWLRTVTETTDVTMSVCTGAFQLATAGLLSGKAATTHHEFVDRFAKAFPDVNVKRGLRFVEGDKISTAGGLSSGIDLALRVVDRYFGRQVAQATATYMEYESKGWIV